MTKLIVIFGFFVAFAAGLIVGLESRRTAGPASPTTRPTNRTTGWLTAELNLTSQQQEQMAKIWSDTAGHSRSEQDDRRRQLRHERDDAIAALVRPEDYGRYDLILKSYSDQTASLDREMHAAFQSAVERTKPLLTPEQRTKYAELLAKHQWDKPSRDRGGRDRDATRRSDVASATTKPTSQSSQR